MMETTTAQQLESVKKSQSITPTDHLFDAPESELGATAGMPLFLQRSGISIQPKLTVGESGDVYEQEADRTAAEIMRMPNPAPTVRPETLSEDEETVQTKPIAISSVNGASLQQKCSECEQEQVQRSGKGNAETDGDIESRLSSSKGGGSPLSDEVRSFMEPRFGADFSQVRTHTDGEAVQMNRAIGAQAFTHGNNIYYGAGKSPANSDLTAHELTHVVQQSGNFSMVSASHGQGGASSGEDVSNFQGAEGAGGAPSTEEARNIYFTIAADQEASWWTPAWYSEFNVGHAWIMIRLPDGSKDSYGFWPASLGRGGGFNPKKPYKNVPGEVRHPDTKHTPTAKHTILVNSFQMQKGINYAIKNASANYNLFWFNCTTFARNMFSEATGAKALHAGLLIDDPNDLDTTIKKENHLRGLDSLENKNK